MALIRVAAVLLLMIILVVPAPVVQAQDGPPPMPALCYGELTIKGRPAPVGTTVTAKVNGEVRGEFVTTEAGWYGGPGLKSKLTVDAQGLSSEKVRFYLSGTFDGKSYSNVFATEWTFWGSGEVEQINIAIQDISSGVSAEPASEAPAEQAETETADSGSNNTTGTSTGDSAATSSNDGGSDTSQNGEADEPEDEAADDQDAPVDEEIIEDVPADDDDEGETDLLAGGEDPGGGETASRAISTGWTVGVGLVLAAALVTLGAGYYIRKKPLKNNSNAKH